MKQKTRFLTAGGLTLGIVIVIGINLLSNTLVRSARLDLTEQGLYTLSSGTRHLLEALEEPVTIRLFLSRDVATRLPGINTYATRVRELLEEFERLAGDNLDLRIVDPEPFSEQEDRAVAYGLEGVPLGDGDSVLYFGLAASGPTGTEEVIPFFSNAREEFLEYDLARVIHQVSRRGDTVVGMLSTLPMQGGAGGMLGAGMSPPWAMIDQIEQFFKVETLPRELTKVPDDVDVLMVVNPSGLGEGALYAVDQFVLGGGRAIVFVDPLAEGDPSSMMGGMSSRDGYDFDALLASWGLKLRPAALAADMNIAPQVRTRTDGRNVVVNYPVWLKLHAGLYDHTDVITAELGDVTMASAGILDRVPRDGVEVSALIRTTEAAAAVDPVRVAPGADIVELIRNFQPGVEALMVAARVTGTLSTAFPDGPPTPETDESAAGDEADEDAAEQRQPETGVSSHLSTSTTSANVVVVADTDLLQDRFWVSRQNLFGADLLIPTAANNTLVVNALENLAGDENLISIRSRGGHSRPFTLLENVRREAEYRFRQKEEELLDELERTEQRLTELQDQGTEGDGLILSEEQRRELERFREQKVRIRKDLREVRRNLREDIESIQAGVRFVNIGLVPLLIAIGGALFAASRHNPRRRRDA